MEQQTAADIALRLSRLQVDAPVPARDEPVRLIDQVTECKTVCEKLMEEKNIAVDLEGEDLGRTGKICLLQIATRSRVYLFDIVALGSEGFASGGLRLLLESPETVKLMYDGRADADALFHQFRVRIVAALDMQVLYLKRIGAYRTRFLPGMQKALSDALPASTRAAADALKEEGKRLFAPERGGSYSVWSQRPLQPALVDYASADVRHLFTMLDLWGGPGKSCVTLDEAKKMTARRMEAAIDRAVPWPRGPKSQWSVVDF